MSEVQNDSTLAMKWVWWRMGLVKYRLTWVSDTGYSISPLCGSTMYRFLSGNGMKLLLRVLRPFRLFPEDLDVKGTRSEL